MEQPGDGCVTVIGTMVPSDQAPEQERIGLQLLEEVDSVLVDGEQPVKAERMTLADFKRQFQLGTQIRQVWNEREGEVDLVFTVTRVLSIGIKSTCPDLEGVGRMDFPKSGEIEFTEDGWYRLKEGQRIAQYVWVRPS